MPVSVRKQGTVAVVAIEGKLAMGGMLVEFRSKWAQAVSGGAQNLVVDLSKVPMADSSGIGSLIRCHSAVNANGGKVKLAGVNEVVRQSFKTTRLDKVFEFYDDENAALASFSQTA